MPKKQYARKAPKTLIGRLIWSPPIRLENCPNPSGDRRSAQRHGYSHGTVAVSHGYGYLGPASHHSSEPQNGPLVGASAGAGHGRGAGSSFNGPNMPLFNTSSSTLRAPPSAPSRIGSGLHSQPGGGDRGRSTSSGRGSVFQLGHDPRSQMSMMQGQQLAQQQHQHQHQQHYQHWQTQQSVRGPAGHSIANGQRNDQAVYSSSQPSSRHHHSQSQSQSRFRQQGSRGTSFRSSRQGHPAGTSSSLSPSFSRMAAAAPVRHPSNQMAGTAAAAAPLPAQPTRSYQERSRSMSVASSQPARRTVRSGVERYTQSGPRHRLLEDLGD
ncbi:MAG: hypothetical protein M1837_003526 [Sclerophora amabilis]|nr:MAG: hypothetical protein M1837_003526 [Sclerophora amabilis]